MEIPSDEEVKNSSIEVDYGFGSKIDKMFEKPLEADLEFLAKVSDYTAWKARPHAKIAVKSYINDIDQSLEQGEVVKGLMNLSKVISRYNFDPYFCVGEISAAFSKTLDTIIKRSKQNTMHEFLKIFELCVIFYYKNYLTFIDGSDGVWQVPYARFPVLYKQLIKLGVEKNDIGALRNNLNKKNDGWRDIFEDLGLT